MEQLPHCVLSNMLASASELTGFLQLYLLVLYIHTLAWENSPKQKVVKSTFFFITTLLKLQARHNTVLFMMPSIKQIMRGAGNGQLSGGIEISKTTWLFSHLDQRFWVLKKKECYSPNHI